MSSDSTGIPRSGGDNEETVVGRAGNGTGASLRFGTVLSNTYSIEQLLARGGMGEVYRARHLELGTLHAIKLILPELAEDPLIIRLFVEEARQLGRINNDAIVQYQGFLRDERGARYLVMEFVEGEPVAELLQRRRFEPAEVLTLLERVGQGLIAVHERGIIHRDISPANILLPDGGIGRAKLIDFGIAKAAEPSPLTLVGTDFAGKYSFVSPEQAGLFGGVVDQRSDIYSFGLVLAAVARGRNLEMGSSLASVIEARQGIPDLASLPDTLRPLIERMLQPDPANRPPSMAAVIEQARPAAIVSGIPAVPQPSRSRRLPLLLAGGAAVAAVAVAGLLYLMPARPSVDQLTAAVARTTSGYTCAELSYAVAADRAVAVSGSAASPADVARLRKDIDGLPGIGKVNFNVQPRIWSYCDISKMLKPLLASPETRVAHFSLAADNPAQVASPLVLDVGMPRFDGYIYVDYFTDKGEVLHLLPNDKDRINLRPARNSFFVGKPPAQGCWKLAGPVGKQAAIVVVADAPLFPQRGPDVEDGRAYLQRLSTALDNAGGRRQAAGVLFFDVQPAKTPLNANDDPCAAR